MSNRALNVLLVDDHILLMDALAGLLEKESGLIEVVGYAANGRDAIEQALKFKPDLVLMDLLMPIMNGNEATCQIIRRLPESRVLILSANNKAEEVAMARKCGASGYILKNIEQQELFNVINQVMSDNCPFIEPNFVPQITQPEKYPNPLTQRELQILKMLAEGDKNRDIATALEISVRTVEKHRTNLLNKLNRPSPVEIVHIAREFGVIG